MSSFVKPDYKNLFSIPCQRKVLHIENYLRKIHQTNFIINLNLIIQGTIITEHPHQINGRDRQSKDELFNLSLLNGNGIYFYFFYSVSP